MQSIMGGTPKTALHRFFYPLLMQSIMGGIPTGRRCFATPDSRLPTPDSRLPTPYSRLPKFDHQTDALEGTI
ncbi:MAG: hypothetical protein F6K49_02350 [Moorea sp. SIO3I6]|nr:hypothetical protein [Moorena sp. SIO3I6]